MRNPRLILAAATLLVALTGCSTSPTVTGGDTESAPTTGGSAASTAPATAADQAAPDAANQPDASLTGVAAASQLLTIRWELMRDKDYDAVCTLYSPGFFERLATTAATEETGCPAVVAAAVKKSDDGIALAKKEGYVALAPYYYVPTSVKLDDSKLEEDSLALVYAAGSALASTDTTTFREGATITPGWLTEPTYLQHGADGFWRFISSTER